MTVIWIILEVIFLFFFFELPAVDDTVKSKYEEYLEYKHRQQQVQNSSDKQSGADKKDVNVVKEQNPNSDASPSASVQEKMPLLSNDSMQDVPAASNRNITLPSQNVFQRAYWLLNG